MGVGGGPDWANLITDSWGGVAEEAICVSNGKWKWSGGARDHCVSIISHRKWAPQKRPVIAHIKAASKHSLETETVWHEITN